MMDAVSKIGRRRDAISPSRVNGRLGPAHVHDLDDHHVGHDGVDRANGVVVHRTAHGGPAPSDQQTESKRPHLWPERARVGRVGDVCRATGQKRLVLPASGISAMTSMTESADYASHHIHPSAAAVRDAPRS
jgi:hypothetical protein